MTEVIPVIAAQPVNFPKKYMALAACYGWVNGIPSYADSITVKCKMCDGDCYIGPLQQEKMKEIPEAIIVCYACIADEQQKNGTKMTFQQLGSQEKMKYHQNN